MSIEDSALIEGTVESGLADGTDPTNAVITAKHIHDVLNPDAKPIKNVKQGNIITAAKREKQRIAHLKKHDPNGYREEMAYKRGKMTSKSRERYYRRLRALPLIDHEEVGETESRTYTTRPVTMLTTRYGFGLSRRKPHNVYYCNGMFYRIWNVTTLVVENEPREWQHCFIPIQDETIQDMHVEQTMEQGKCPTVSIHVVNGKPVSIVGGTNPLDATEFHPEDMDVDFLEALLDLAFNPHKKEDRKKKLAEKKRKAKAREAWSHVKKAA